MPARQLGKSDLDITRGALDRRVHSRIKVHNTVG
jgi:hypothetical protein